MLPRASCVLGLVLASAVSACLLPHRQARAAATGRLYVKSRPSRATVYLDEETESRGETPCLLGGLPPGTHVVRAHLAGYADVSREVEVRAGAMGRLVLTFGAKLADDGGAESGEAAVGPDLQGDLQGESTEPAAAVPDEETAEADEPPEASHAAASATDRPPKQIDVDCPVCRGTGMLQDVACPRCNGTGWDGIDRCGKCGMSRRVEYDCPACGGAGVVVRGGREADCRSCKGKGKPPCPLCRGKGKLKRRNRASSSKPTMTCPYCGGSGFEEQMKCLRCSGKGKYIPHGGGWVVLHVDCPFCGGDGRGPPLCRRCRGSGLVGTSRTRVPCAGCFGTGRLFPACRACRGKGWIVSK